MNPEPIYLPVDGLQGLYCRLIWPAFAHGVEEDLPLRLELIELTGEGLHHLQHHPAIGAVKIRPKGLEEGLGIKPRFADIVKGKPELGEDLVHVDARIGQLSEVLGIYLALGGDLAYGVGEPGEDLPAHHWVIISTVGSTP